MKEIKLSFKIKYSIKSEDIHWGEEELLRILLRIREKIFKEVFRRVQGARTLHKKPTGLFIVLKIREERYSTGFTA